jgi:hypothetical protein
VYFGGLVSTSQITAVLLFEFDLAFLLNREITNSSASSLIETSTAQSRTYCAGGFTSPVLKSTFLVSVLQNRLRNVIVAPNVKTHEAESHNSFGPSIAAIAGIEWSNATSGVMPAPPTNAPAEYPMPTPTDRVLVGNLSQRYAGMMPHASLHMAAMMAAASAIAMLLLRAALINTWKSGMPIITMKRQYHIVIFLLPHLSESQP